MERNDSEFKAAKRLPIMEIFGPTLQGEGAMIGVRTSFIRFGLCDYKCVMCDSMHAVDPVRVNANANWLTQEETAHQLLAVHIPNPAEGFICDWVTFSGGNPCIHDLNELILRIRGFDILGGRMKIAVETQGTLLPSWLHMCDVITVSPKSPGMGEKFEQDKFLQFVLQFKHHPGFNVKMVVFSMADMEWASGINNIMIDEGLGDKVYLSLGNPFPPGKDEHTDKAQLQHGLLQDYEVLVEDLLQMPHLKNIKFLPQMHVLLWGNRQKV